jgi:hypothetical protein
MKKGKLFNKPILVRKHPLGDGVQRIYRFSNGYGASIVRFKIPTSLGVMGFYGSYTNNENEWELAVIKFKGKESNNFELCYDTPITNDVIGYLTEDEVEEILKKIKNLPKVEK